MDKGHLNTGIKGLTLDSAEWPPCPLNLMRVLAVTHNKLHTERKDGLVVESQGSSTGFTARFPVGLLTSVHFQLKSTENSLACPFVSVSSLWQG